MSQRINISIRDEVYEKLQAYKDRINVSRICQEAIVHQLKLEEIKDSVIPDTEKLVVRLKEERKQYAQKFEEEGFEDGVKDAHNMSYDAFFHFIAHVDDDTSEEAFGWGASEESIEKVKEKSRYYDDEDLLYGGFADFRDLYFYGWVKGVSHVWNQVKDKLEIE